MKKNQNEILSTFDNRKIFLAIFLGLGVTAFMFYKQIKGQDISEIFALFSNINLMWVFIAFLVLLIRDAGYMYRIRELTQRELTLKGSVFTILLWEFASAATPSVVGGTAVAVFILNKEGISFGKSLAYVMLTAILDNSFFLIAAPIALYLGSENMFPVISVKGAHVDLKYIFYLSYSLIAVYTLFMAFSILFFPKAFRSGLVFIVGISYKALRWRTILKIRSSIKEYYDDIILASSQLKNKPISYWAKAIISTMFVWSARYFILNCVIAMFKSDFSLFDHFDAFSKQIVLWITQLLSPTPGGSGLAEYFLSEIFGGGTVILAIALVWRMLTYYSYLLIGSFVLPRWLKRVIDKD